jgi:hypothetical protein
MMNRTEERVMFLRPTTKQKTFQKIQIDVQGAVLSIPQSSVAVAFLGFFRANLQEPGHKVVPLGSPFYLMQRSTDGYPSSGLEMSAPLQIYTFARLGLAPSRVNLLKGHRKVVGLALRRTENL